MIRYCVINRIWDDYGNGLGWAEGIHGLGWVIYLYVSWTLWYASPICLWISKSPFLFLFQFLKLVAIVPKILHFYMIIHIYVLLHYLSL